MSEFSPAEPKASTIEMPAPTQAPSRSVWQRPIVMGLSLPWLIGIALLLALVGWYLFAREENPSVNRLAFENDLEQQPLPAEQSSTHPVVAAAAESDLGQFKNEVAAMIGGVRTYAEVNRTAIQRLSETIKTQGVAQQALQQQLAEAQAQNSVLSARVSFLEGRPGATTTTQQASKPVAKTRSPLNGMRVQAIQNGMAWVYWQDKTWAVSPGEKLGQVTVTGINPQAREVLTSAGTIK
ncbi:conjugal transfer protein TraP [Pseudomonas cerasi]|uniref:TraP protein n=1 Tax=Pseudomonas cerasi TaxID=1583341 RepID=A0A193SFT5_9PSED|nr:conjugal transfer protein TraP [Pseudomonas cerasi]CZT25911.1 traP protein [Pseudomonas cerasi]SOS30329.1 traP protein [Pseudomonas cerasi]